MSNLVAIAFDDEHTAFDMRAALAKMQKEYLIDMADVVVVTSDNPRGEDPAAIIEDVVVGCVRDKVTVQADRRKAIATALEQAEKGDLVAIAGKGHEDYQLVGGERLPFDDRVVAREVLEQMREGGKEAERSEK